MNKKLAFYARPYPWVKTFRDMVDCAVECGISAIEASGGYELTVPTEETARELRAYADSRGIKFTCFSMYIDLVGDDARKNIEQIKAYAQTAAILGSPYLHFTIASECCEPQNVLPNKEEYYQKGIAAVREIYDYAESFGVKCVFEDQGYIFNGVTDFGRFLNDVQRDVKVVADFGNIYEVEETIEDFIKTYNDKIINVHIKDLTLDPEDKTGVGLKSLRGGYMNECEPGTGIVDIKGLIDLLKSYGYDGYYALEYGASSDSDPSMERVLKLLSDMLD